MVVSRDEKAAMNDKLDELLGRLKPLEDELVVAVHLHSNLRCNRHWEFPAIGLGEGIYFAGRFPTVETVGY